MRKLIVFLLTLTLSGVMYAQNKPAYKLYNAKGAKVSYKKMIYLENTITTQLYIGYSMKPQKIYMRREN